MISNNGRKNKNKLKQRKNKLLKDVKITQNAYQKILELKNDNQNIFIRVMITSGGCAGKQYHILMDDYIGETDYLLRKRFHNKNSVFIVIDEESLNFLHNSKIDYSEDLEFSGFTINNPNITGTCSCGNSFSCKECSI